MRWSKHTFGISPQITLVYNSLRSGYLLLIVALHAVNLTEYVSRKSKNRIQAAPVTAKLYVFAVADSVSNACVEVAAPVFYQLIRRGWATQTGTENTHDKTTKRPIERRIAKLVSRLSFRSLKPAPNGNLCFKSLLEAIGAPIKSQWELAIEKAWTLEGFPRSFCPQTWEEKIQLQQDRQRAIEDECLSWGVPEPQPVRIRASLYAT